MKLMLRIFLAVLICASGAFAQAEKPPADIVKNEVVDKTQIDTFKKEAGPLQAAIEDSVNSALPGAGVLEHAKATYLDGYGVVVSLEASLEPALTPFSTTRSPAQLKSLMNEKKNLVQQKLETLLKDRLVKLQCLGEADSLTIALHLFNANPVDISNFPAQLQFTVKKQDPTHVILREF